LRGSRQLDLPIQTCLLEPAESDLPGLQVADPWRRSCRPGTS